MLPGPRRRARPNPASRSVRRIGHKDSASANHQKLTAACVAPFVYYLLLFLLAYDFLACSEFSGLLLISLLLACGWPALASDARGRSLFRLCCAVLTQSCRHGLINYTVSLPKSIQMNSRPFVSAEWEPELKIRISPQHCPVFATIRVRKARACNHACPGEGGLSR